MKNLNLLVWCVLTVIISVFVSGLVLNHNQPITQSAPVKRESSYDRVMRTGVLRCGYFAWPPFFIKDEKTAAITGLLPDVLGQMMETIGLHVEYVESTLGQQPQDLANNKYDAFCMDSFLMPKASKFVDYTKPWSYLAMYLYGPKSADKITDLQTLNSPNYTFSTIDGDCSLDLAVRSFPKAKQLSLPSTADSSLSMLNVTTGKANVFITDQLTIDRFNATNDNGLSRLYEKPVAIYPNMLSVKKGEIDLQNMLNYAVDIFIYTGDYETILNRYDPDKIFIRVDNKRN